jgi:hypothetical protein
MDKAFDQAKKSLKKKFSGKDADIPVLEAKEKGVFFVPPPGEGTARIESRAPRYSNLRSALPEPGAHYYENSLIDIAEALKPRKESIVVLSGSSPGHRLKVARAAVERNSWRFGGGIICASGESREPPTDTILKTIAKVLELNINAQDRGTILSTLKKLAEQGQPILLVLPEIDPRVVVPNSECIELLTEAVASYRNKALITCSQLPEASKRLHGLVEIPLVHEMVASHVIIVQQ